MYQDVDAVLSFSLSLANIGWKDYTQFILPNIIKYSMAHWTNYHKITIFLSQLLHTKAIIIPTGTISSFITKEGLIQFSGYPDIENSENVIDGLLGILSINRNWNVEVQKLSLVDIDDDINDFPELSLVAAAINLLPHIAVSFQSAAACLGKTIRTLLDCLNKSKRFSALPLDSQKFTKGSFYIILEYILGLCIESFAEICRKHDSTSSEAVDSLADVIINEVLFNYGANEVILRGSASYLTLLQSR
jgi:hypothetical protein